MTPARRLFEYARAVLAFDFKGAPEAAPPPAPEPEAARRMARRCAQAFERSGRERLCLLGLGSGAVAGELAALLPPGALFVCERDLALTRALLAKGALPWFAPDGLAALAPAALAVDASPWALLLLLDRAGLRPGGALVLPNPELAPARKAPLRTLELLLGQCQAAPTVDPSASPELAISAAAILSPSEPDLPEFLAQFPPWLHELVLLWDAEAVPGISAPAAPGLDVRQFARPLGRDFSAQRNAALARCRGDFVFFLDADERLTPGAWQALPALCALSRVAGVGGWHFPRRSPYPDAAHALTGFGLWPDLQLRLFARTPGLCFVNPVHERLVGVEGRLGIAPDVEILHLSRLRKTDEDIARKLAGFDAAGGGSVRHALSAGYPSVAAGLLAADAPSSRGLLLPAQAATSAQGLDSPGRSV